jgi:hypothetical protein
LRQKLIRKKMTTFRREFNALPFLPPKKSPAHKDPGIEAGGGELGQRCPHDGAKVIDEEVMNVKLS